MRGGGVVGCRASSTAPARRCGSRSETETQKLISTPGKPGARFFCPKPQLGSFTVSNGLSKTKGPLRRPVKTTRILIAVGGPCTDCFRSQLRRLGFGQPHQARPRHGCANIPCGSQVDPQNRNFLLWWEQELSTLARHLRRELAVLGAESRSGTCLPIVDIASLENAGAGRLDRVER